MDFICSVNIVHRIYLAGPISFRTISGCYQTDISLPLVSLQLVSLPLVSLPPVQSTEPENSYNTAAVLGRSVCTIGQVRMIN